MLVPESQYDVVFYADTRIELSVTDTIQNATLTTFQLKTTEIADSRDAYVEMLTERAVDVAVTLDRGELSEAQREILETAITDDFHTQCLNDEIPQDYEMLIRRIFEDIGELRELEPRERFVIYDDTLYEASYTVAVD